MVQFGCKYASFSLSHKFMATQNCAGLAPLGENPESSSCFLQRSLYNPENFIIGYTKLFFLCLSIDSFTEISSSTNRLNLSWEFGQQGDNSGLRIKDEEEGYDFKSIIPRRDNTPTLHNIPKKILNNRCSISAENNFLSFCHFRQNCKYKNYKSDSKNPIWTWGLRRPIWTHIQQHIIFEDVSISVLYHGVYLESQIGVEPKFN